MKSLVFIVYVFMVMAIPYSAFSAITLNGNVVELSGTVTANDIIASAYFSTSGNIVTPNYNTKLMTGVVLQLGGLIWNINDRDLIVEDPSNPPELSGVTIQIDSNADHWEARNLNLKNSAIMGFRTGSSIVSLSKAENVVCGSVGTPNSGGNRSSSIFFEQGGIFKNVTLENMDRLGVAGGGATNIAYRIIDLNYKGYNAQMKIGYNNAPSSIWQDLSHEGTTAFSIDTYLASQANHTILLLGESVETFYRGGTTFPRTNAHGRTRIKTGGIKYWKVLNGSGGKVEVYDSRSITAPQQLLLTLDNWELLDTVTSFNIPISEECEFTVFTGEKTTTTNTTVLSAITSQNVFVKVFGKRIYKKSYNTVVDAELTEGSEDSFVPIVLTDEAVVTDSEVDIRAYTELENLDKFVQRLHVLALDVRRSDIESDGNFYTISGSKLDLGSYNLVIDNSASDVIHFDGNNTLTIKSSVLEIGSIIESIKTTGSISVQNGSLIEFGYEDNTGIHKFVHLDWNENSSQNITVENLSTSTPIINAVSATEVYKGHFLMPNPAPASGINVEIESPAGFNLFQELFPEDDLNFIRLDIKLNASEEKQKEMLFLAKKILQKSEGINEAVSGTTPSIVDNTTVTNSNATATNENQEAILQLLRRILNKVSANKEAFNE